MPIIGLTTGITGKADGSFELEVAAVELEEKSKPIHQAELCFDDVQDAHVAPLKFHSVDPRQGSERMAHVGSQG